MDTFLEDHSVAIKEVPFGLPAADKPTPEEVESVVEELKQYDGFTLPEDYQKFCLAYGGGTLGRVKM